MHLGCSLFLTFSVFHFHLDLAILRGAFGVRIFIRFLPTLETLTYSGVQGSLA